MLQSNTENSNIKIWHWNCPIKDQQVFRIMWWYSKTNTFYPTFFFIISNNNYLQTVIFLSEEKSFLCPNTASHRSHYVVRMGKRELTGSRKESTHSTCLYDPPLQTATLRHSAGTSPSHGTEKATHTLESHGRQKGQNTTTHTHTQPGNLLLSTHSNEAIQFFFSFERCL